MDYTDITSVADCEECFDCSGAQDEIHAIWDDLAGVGDFLPGESYFTMAYNGAKVFDYPAFDGTDPWDPEGPSSVCACLYDHDMSDVDVGTYVLNVTDKGTCEGPDMVTDLSGFTGIVAGDGSQYIFDDIDSIAPDTGFLTSPWNLETTNDWSLTDNLGTGKVGIYYDRIDDEGTAVNLYHTIYHHDALTVYDPHSGEAGSGGSSHTWAFQVELDDAEIDGLRAKFGGDEVDIEDSLETSINSLIEIIAAAIVESQFTFKKIKQPTVDVRLFSAFEEGQKEETQTLSVATTSTKTTY